MKVLLLEPPYPRALPPLGLMKISSFHKSQGDEVRNFRGDPWFVDWDPELVYVTSSIFSWYVPESIETIRKAQKRFPNATIKTGGVMASHNWQYFEQATGIRPHVGILWAVEGHRPDYEGFNWKDISLIFTSRGCWVGCPFCGVPALEGKSVVPIEGWQNHVEPSWRDLVIQDNNLTAAPWHHFESVIAFLKGHKFRVDLNSGIEPHSFTEKHAEQMQGITWNPIRTAFDQMEEEKQWTRAMELIKTYLSTDYRRLMVYVLFDFKDDPEEALYRALKVIELEGSPWPMPYRPLDWFSKTQYIGENWTGEQVSKFYRFFSRATIWRHFKKKHGDPTLKDIFGASRRCARCDKPGPQPTPAVSSATDSDLKSAGHSTS